MTRAVLDANVLISAFISRRGGSPDRIVRAWRAESFELVVSPQLLAELTDVLSRPKFARQAGDGDSRLYIADFAENATQFPTRLPPPTVTADPDDDYLIALARAAGADMIVSGDGHLLDLENPDPPVLTPRQFAKHLDI